MTIELDFYQAVFHRALASSYWIGFQLIEIEREVPKSN